MMIFRLLLCLGGLALYLVVKQLMATEPAPLQDISPGIKPLLSRSALDSGGRPPLRPTDGQGEAQAGKSKPALDASLKASARLR